MSALNGTQQQQHELENKQYYILLIALIKVINNHVIQLNLIQFDNEEHYFT